MNLGIEIYSVMVELSLALNLKGVKLLWVEFQLQNSFATAGPIKCKITDF